MPKSRRQEALREAARSMFEEDFAGRCLPFDEGAARHYARIVSARLKAGRPISVEDAQIAAIALEHKMRLAMRNTTDFEHIAGLDVVNPWTAETSHVCFGTHVSVARVACWVIFRSETR